MPIMISLGMNFAAIRWKKETGPGVDTGSPRRLSDSARRTTVSFLEASGKCRIALLPAVSFAFGINSVFLIQ